MRMSSKELKLVMRRMYVVVASLLLGMGCELRAPVQKPPEKTETLPTTPKTVGTSEHVTYLSGGEGSFALASLKGRVVLLDVCAPWSLASRAQIADLNQLAQREASAGLVVVGLVVDASVNDGLTPEIQALGAEYPLLATPRSWLARFGDVRSIPSRLLVDRKGVVRKIYPGVVAAEIMDRDIRDILKE